MKLKPRQIAKFAVKTFVNAAAGSAIKKGVVAAFPSTEETIIPGITGGVGGFIISEELKPHTDKAVDCIADKINELKQKNETPKS